MNEHGRPLAVGHPAPRDLADVPIAANRDYSALSLRDLLDAREQYHVHLMRQPNVIATAIGYYRIRSGDSWPGQEPVIKGKDKRTLTNSEIRPYSWPAVLVFVEEWAEASEFSEGGNYHPDSIVPSTLYLPDGRRIPVCVIEAPKELEGAPGPLEVRYPLNNIGSGHPVTVSIQGRDHFATVGCLVTDGHRAYALTNRHVTGSAGEIITSKLAGRECAIGTAASLAETRAVLSDIYPGWAGGSTFVNLDIGLIDIDRLDDWTTRLKDGSLMGPMLDLSSSNFPLSLVGACVKGWGAASGLMEAEIHGLFYRYKSRGGFEYVSDFFIGPRRGEKAPRFSTQAGDSGTLWLVEPALFPFKEIIGKEKAELLWRPLAIQWGANRLYSALDAGPQAFALATCMSTVCGRLDLDVVRDWNLDQPDTWGAVGHFAIATRAVKDLSADVPNLRKLINKNARVIGPDDQIIESSEFKGMGDDAFVPLADVPDFYWKHGKQGASRHFEGPNHFADMDQPGPHNSETLLTLCKKPQNIDAKIWNNFYDSVSDLATDEPITDEHRGLLPFRVWQIFKAMVEFAGDGPEGDLEKFVCAAGVLAHYVGDACQPLHISYLHDGDPLTGTMHTVHHHDGTTSDVLKPKGMGVHSAYEDGMVNSHRAKILAGLDKAKPVTSPEYIKTGKDAAELLVQLMRNTFAKIPPKDIVKAYVQLTDKKRGNTELWKDFGTDTISVMAAGTHTLAVLWESAWVLGGAETRGDALPTLTENKAMKICADPEFLPSCSIKQVSQYL